MTDADAEPTTVLYIMGAGRSGSTALGITLSNLPRVYYGGELFSWAKFTGRPYTDDEESLALWERFAAEFPAGDTMFGEGLERIEHPSVLARPWLLRPTLIRKHRRHNRVLFARLREFMDADVIVDSSHYPMRAALLWTNPGIDLRIVHLVRDPRDVVNALQNAAQRQRPMPPWAANVYCWVVASLSTLVLRFVPTDRRVVVRFEDFVRDPAVEVDRIATMLDAHAELDFDDLEVGEVFQGNRLRLRPRLSIRSQDHVSRLSARWQRVTEIAQWPLLVGYRYRRGQRRDRLSR